MEHLLKIYLETDTDRSDNEAKLEVCAPLKLLIAQSIVCVRSSILWLKASDARHFLRWLMYGVCFARFAVDAHVCGCQSALVDSRIMKCWKL
jgi:hypothetical protein